MASRPNQSNGAERLPDFLVALQGDPFIEIRWKKALVTRLREQKTPKDGGSESTRTGGRFAYRLNATQRIRNAIRAPQAVVKIVRGGGAGSAGDLDSQLNYLSRDGELALDEYEPDGTNFDLQGSSEIKNLSHVWAQRWDDAETLDGRAARSKSKTYHLIVSFPEGTDEERAHDAANTFADRFLTSGDMGDRWSHIRAWHTDRAHPHMHIVIDRRGENGRMMQINPARDISPARLRGLQVDAAAEHGLLLNSRPGSRADCGVRSFLLLNDGQNSADSVSAGTRTAVPMNTSHRNLPTRSFGMKRKNCAIWRGHWMSAPPFTPTNKSKSALSAPSWRRQQRSKPERTYPLWNRKHWREMRSRSKRSAR